MGSIEEYKEKINSVIKEFLEKKLSRDGKSAKEVRELIENVLEFNMRAGKRIRPLIILAAYNCFKDGELALKPSICIELMQAYLLIHDDIMDRSDLRRRKPTIHKIYERKYNNPHLGISMGINAGDLCSAYMYEIIIDSDFNEKEKLEAIKYIDWILEREIYGQTLDNLPGFENLKEEDVMKIYELKTATYTVQGPVKVGCALAGASEETIKKFNDYSYNLGVAFQLQDDIVGIYGDIAKTGKPIDSDIREGKRTLLIAKALELANKEQKEFLLKNYGKNNLNEDEIEKIANIIKETGALDYCKKKLDNLINKAKDSLMPLNLKEKGKTFLIEMADFIGSLVK